MDLTRSAGVDWPSARPASGPLRWFARMGPAYTRADEAGTVVVPPVEALTARSAIEIQSWLLVEGWWRGLLDADRLVQLLGGQPDGSLEDALADLEQVEVVWDGLRPSELDSVCQWGAEVLRGHGADGLLCLESQVLVLLGSTPGVRVRPEPSESEQPIMLSETDPPARPDPPPEPPKPPPARPVKPPSFWRHDRGPQGALLDAFGLRVGFVGLRRPHLADSVLELKRQLLLDGLDGGILTHANLLLAFRRLGEELQPDEVREMLVDHADRLQIHPELALQVTAPMRRRLFGCDGVAFRSGTTDRIILPHYYLRRRCERRLWRRICEGE